MDNQAGWEISETLANETERRRQELLSRLREGDLSVGNGIRSGTDADTGRDVVGSSVKGIVGSGANLVSNVGKNLERIDARFWKPPDAVSDLINGEPWGSSRQRRIKAYEDPSSQEKWAGIDAFADRMDDDSAALLQRAKEGKSLAGEFGVDVAKGALDTGFDASAAALTGGSALVPMAGRVYGESVGRARRAGATLEQQTGYALANTVIEVASEKLFDGAARIYGAGAADDIVERLVGRMAESDAGRTTLRMIAGAAGEGTEELISDLLAPLAESIYRDEGVGELYRGLDPAELLHDYLIGATLGTVGGGVSIAAGQSAEANRALRAQDAAEQAYLEQMERLGYVPPADSKNAAHDEAAESMMENTDRADEAKEISGLQDDCSESIMAFRMVNTGGRRNELPLTAEQIASAEQMIRAQGYDGEVAYSDSVPTGFIGFPDGTTLMVIGTDAFPSQMPKNANEALPMNAAMAHEIVGHYEAWLRGTVLMDRILDEVQASVRAARFAVGLAEEERNALMQDAFFRLRKAGRSFEDVEDLLDIKERTSW